MNSTIQLKCIYIGIFLHHKYNISDGELGASLRYLSQKFTMVTPEAKATLNDIATEEFALIAYQLRYIIFITTIRIALLSLFYLHSYHIVAFIL